MARKSISPKTKFEIFKRDGFTCQYCGSHPPSAILHIDHINPVSKGGDNSDGNLITSCSNCNGGKAARLLTSIPKSLKQKSEEIAEKEKQINGYYKVMEAQKIRIETDVWRVAEILCKSYPIDGMRRDWFNSIKRFNENLGVHVVMDAMEIAASKFTYSEAKAFSYFCGICWNKIKEAKND